MICEKCGKRLTREDVEVWNRIGIARCSQCNQEVFSVVQLRILKIIATVAITIGIAIVVSVAIVVVVNK